jgi:pimeloyl-ACP methyl ester carboxylesterase
MKVAKEIPGAKFIRLNGFGHFPMTEDPNRLFGEYLSSVLDEYLRVTNF